MPIDDTLSAQFRVMLQYAIQNRVEDFMKSLPDVGYTPYESMLALAIRVTGHVVIAACERYPNDADLEKAAGYAANSVTGLPIGKDEIHAYLSRVVFGNERFDVVSDDRTKASVIPMFALANLLVVFTPKGMDQWTYLDVIEASIDAVDNTNEGVLPSMVFEFGRKK